MVLRVLDKVEPKDDETLSLILESLKSARKFVVVFEDEQDIVVNYYRMNESELIHALEWAKFVLLSKRRN